MSAIEDYRTLEAAKQQLRRVFDRMLNEIYSLSDIEINQPSTLDLVLLLLRKRGRLRSEDDPGLTVVDSKPDQGFLPFNLMSGKFC